MHTRAHAYGRTYRWVPQLRAYLRSIWLVADADHSGMMDKAQTNTHPSALATQISTKYFSYSCKNTCAHLLTDYTYPHAFIYVCVQTHILQPTHTHVLQEEYLSMHEHMCIAMGKCDAAGKVSKEMKKHALSDWETDRKGRPNLN